MQDGRAREAEQNRALLELARYTRTESEAMALGERDAPALDDRSPAGMLAAIAGYGFEPVDVTSEDDREAGRMVIELAACPYADAVEGPGGAAVCAYHRGVVAGLVGSLGATLGGVDVRPPRSGRCTVRVEDLHACEGEEATSKEGSAD